MEDIRFDDVERLKGKIGVSFGPFQEGATRAHLEIVDAIARHDSATARTRMEEHLDCGSRLVKDAVYKTEARQLQLPVRKAGELIDGLILFLQQLIPPDSGVADGPSSLAAS